MKFLHEWDREKEFTFDQAFLLPYNDIDHNIFDICENQEKEWFNFFVNKMYGLKLASDNWDMSSRKTLNETGRQFYNFKSVLCKKYWLWWVTSRDSVDFTPRDYAITWSKSWIVASNMNNVSWKRMAEAMALVWGYAAIPQDLPLVYIKKLVEYMKTRHELYRTPVYLNKNAKVFDFNEYIFNKDLDAAVITDDDWYFIWVLSKKDVERKEPWMLINTLISTKVHTERIWIKPQEAIKLLREYSQDILPILDDQRKVVWVLSKKTAALSLRYRPNLDEVHWWLWVLITVWAFNKDPIERVKALIDLWVRWIILDTAHLDQWFDAYNNINAVANLIAESNQNIFLVAWNVVTASATESTINAWADIVKVWIWPWAMCTTRMETWVWRPQLSSIIECSNLAHLYWKFVWADWWIKYPRDIALALAWWASQVMIWSKFAGTYESPTKIFKDEKLWYFKYLYWMASGIAMVNRHVGNLIRDTLWQRSEWIWSWKIFLGDQPSVNDRVNKFVDWLTSATTFAWATNLEEFYENAIIWLQDWSWYEEWKPVTEM